MPEPTRVAEGAAPSRGRTLVALDAHSMDALAEGAPAAPLPGEPPR